jgi:hypothetical protein
MRHERQTPGVVGAHRRQLRVARRRGLADARGHAELPPAQLAHLIDGVTGMDALEHDSPSSDRNADVVVTTREALTPGYVTYDTRSTKRCRYDRLALHSPTAASGFVRGRSDPSSVRVGAYRIRGSPRAARARATSSSARARRRMRDAVLARAPVLVAEAGGDVAHPRSDDALDAPGADQLVEEHVRDRADQGQPTHPLPDQLVAEREGDRRLELQAERDRGAGGHVRADGVRGRGDLRRAQRDVATRGRQRSRLTSGAGSSNGLGSAPRSRLPSWGRRDPVRYWIGHATPSPS